MPQNGERLTVQECRVIELVAQGKTNREIAHEMGLACSTVKHYVRNICQKLQVPNRAAAATRYYRGIGLLS